MVQACRRRIPMGSGLAGQRLHRLGHAMLDARWGVEKESKIAKHQATSSANGHDGDVGCSNFHCVRGREALLESQQLLAWIPCKCMQLPQTPGTAFAL